LINSADLDNVLAWVQTKTRFAFKITSDDLAAASGANGLDGVSRFSIDGSVDLSVVDPIGVWIANIESQCTKVWTGYGGGR